MSQSPSKSIDPESIVRYKQGWRALNRLLHEDKSFSGHEKNCAFMNMGNGQFASVSSVSGLDFDDDSRAIATCDWDFDGQLDFWITGRTAPRLRLVHNRQQRLGAFVALKLQGDGKSTNRDAIGARVEVVLRNNSDDKTVRLIRTVHAGDAFLSQSSSWLHFGLGSEAEIERVSIRWPSSNGEQRSQTISGVRPNQFYLVRQDRDAATIWQPPSRRVALEPRIQSVPPANGPIRIVLPSRLPLPEIKIVASSNEEDSLPLTGPLLVNIWSATCPICVGELSKWASEVDEFQRRGLPVVAVNADSGSDAAQVNAIVNQLGSAFRWTTATTDSIQAIDYFQRAMLDRWQPLPVPCSFLLDKQGQVVVIYKGEIPTQQLWDDLALLDAVPEQVREAAVPFAGQWLRSVPDGEPTSVSTQMVDHRAVTAAISYLGRFIDTNREGGQHAKAYYVRGILLESQKRFREALESMRQAARLNPGDLRSRADLARLLQQFGQLVEAQDEWVAAYKINANNHEVQLGLATNLLHLRKFKQGAELLERIVAKYPNDAMAHFRLATAYRNLKRWREAVASYSRAVELRPDMMLAANNLAWMLATHPDESLRNGPKAVVLAERVCKATQFKEPQFLDTLSVAYAEGGDFDRATAVAKKAVGILRATGRGTPDTLQPLLDRIEGFEASRPFRDAS